ncbi:MAG: NADH-quinone oxidoreductase subunit N [Methylobacter sp.]|nr:NADH-quinone oxidoreductase subunit N [Methylobacter sp.]
MNIDQLIALAPIMIIAGSAVIIMLIIAIRRNFILVNGVAVCGILLALLAVNFIWQENPVQATALIRIDVYALFYTALLLLTGLSVAGLCYDYFKERKEENEELSVLLLTALLGALVLVSSSHFASFFIGLEMLSISLFVLIGYTINRQNSMEAAIKYLILSGVSSAFILFGMALIYAQCGVLDFDGIGRYLMNQKDMNALVLSGVILIIAGVGFKLSLVPFHLWTPDVYEGAPAPITAFIATVSKGAVFALLLRYFISAGNYSYSPLLTVLSIIAVLSILAGNLLALLQNNVKRLLAYSSIAHMGYVLVAFIAGGRIAPALVVEAVTFYLITYFITTIGAFGVISLLSTPQMEADDLSFYRGLFWRQPWLATIFTLMLISLAGIPLTAGFIGKFYIFASGADASLWGLLLAVIIGSGLGLYYYLRIVVVMSMSVEETASKTGEPVQKKIATTILAVLTLLLLWFGLYPGHLMNFIVSIAATLE